MSLDWTWWILNKYNTVQYGTVQYTNKHLKNSARVLLKKYALLNL